MYIVGIDIGKNHHEASIVSPEGKQIGRSLRFATTHTGADSLMSFIFKNIGNSPCVFGMEATGHYWYPIYSFLKAKGYTIYVINPIQSDSLRKMYITPENIENAPLDELFEIIKDKSHNRLTKAKAISIKEAAADTFGIKIAQDAFSFQLKQLIDRMNFLDKQIEALDIEIMKYYEHFDCYLHTIPGIGIIGAATILAEIGDINRFKSSSALVAFAGIDPTVRQSGEFNSTHNHMSKRGSPYLRHAIFLAATTCSFHNSPLNAYYKKKRDQGKHHLTATGAVARKLTTVIYAVLRDSKPYEPKKFC